MGAAISTRGVAALEAIERLAAEDLSTQQVIEEVVRRITGVIETDAFFAGATDPDTGLCLGAGMAYNLAEGVCHPFWEHEFLIPDYDKFADLTPADPVGDLRQATGGKLTPQRALPDAQRDLRPGGRASGDAAARVGGRGGTCSSTAASAVPRSARPTGRSCGPPRPWRVPRCGAPCSRSRPTPTPAAARAS